MSFKKNTAVTGFTVGLISATDGSDITTGTPAAYVTLDGGTQTSITDSLTHEGNGQWSFDLTAGEMNGDIVGITVTHTSAITVQHTIKTSTVLTSELNDLSAADVNAECDAAISDASLATAASIAALNDFDPATDTVANVTLVATTTTNTDMRGTDNAALASALATVDGIVDSILVDTGTDIPATLAVIDGLIDAIKAKTDSLAFTTAGQVDANIQYINDVAITGDGQSGTEFSV